jgi:hypothetical protein
MLTNIKRIVILMFLTIFCESCATVTDRGYLPPDELQRKYNEHLRKRKIPCQFGDTRRECKNVRRK